MRHSITVALTTCGIILGSLVSVAHSADSKVNCNSPGANGKIGTVLSRLDPAAANIVHVSGSCHENVVIQGFERLSLIAMPGAVIADASGGALAVVEILYSQVMVQGFTIQGGSNGLLCHHLSSCLFTADTVEDTVPYTGINAGITIDGSDAELTNIVVRNVADAGIALWGAKAVASNVSVNGVKNVNPFPGGTGVIMSASSLRNGPITIQYADGTGLQALHGTVLDISALSVTDNGMRGSGFPNGVSIADGSVGNFGQLTVQRNQGAGILAQGGSNINIYGANGIISNNTGPGIFLQWGARLIHFANTTVTNNQFGLYATDVSLAVFGGGTFTQNTITDISCDGPPPALVLGIGSVVFGSTDCPPPPLAPAKVH